MRVKKIWIPKSLTTNLKYIKQEAMKTMRVTRKEQMPQLMIIVTILRVSRSKKKPSHLRDAAAASRERRRSQELGKSKLSRRSSQR